MSRGKTIRDLNLLRYSTRFYVRGDRRPSIRHLHIRFFSKLESSKPSRTVRSDLFLLTIRRWPRSLRVWCFDSFRTTVGPVVSNALRRSSFLCIFQLSKKWRARCHRWIWFVSSVSIRRRSSVQLRLLGARNQLTRMRLPWGES